MSSSPPQTRCQCGDSTCTLSGDEHGPPSDIVEVEWAPKPSKITPLPKLQLFIAIFIQVAEPVTCTVIYPLVNDLIRELGITHGDETKTGYYVGIVESIFYAAECLTVMHWGKASDIVGRKPILLGGMAGLAFSMVGFGLSKRYWMLLVSRCAQGAFNGNIGVTKSVMAEITDSTNAPQAFAFLPVAWSVGSTLGPAIGGALAKPADLWPTIFGNVEFFKAFPYFLPCFVAALVPICAFLLASLCLKETAPAVLRRERAKKLKSDYSIAAGHRESQPLLTDASRLLHNSEPSDTSTFAADYGTTLHDGRNRRPVSSCSTETYTGSSGTRSHSPDSSSSSGSASEEKQTAPSFRSIFIPQVLIPITNFAFLAFLDQCILVLIPLVYSTPLDFGGLDLSPSEIGSILGVWGILNGIVQVLCFAWVRERVGHRRTYVLGIAGMFFVFAMFPVLSVLVDWNGGEVGWLVYVGVALQLGFYSFSYMSYACMFLYIAAAAPSRASLGTTNGLAQLTASGVRAIAPTTASSLFSLSLTLRSDQGVGAGAGGYLVYIVINLITLGALVWSRWLPRELSQGASS